MSPEIIRIKIEDNFAGHYRLEYDGKYITIYGWDKNYPVFGYFDSSNPAKHHGRMEYEEMVLVPCALEIRKAKPEIEKVDQDFIYVKLNLS